MHILSYITRVYVYRSTIIIINIVMAMTYNIKITNVHQKENHQVWLKNAHMPKKLMGHISKQVKNDPPQKHSLSWYRNILTE